MYFKIKRIGQNLIVIEDSKAPYTITLPKDYNFDKIFSLAYRANNQIKVAETLLLKELKKFEKPKVVDSKIIETRIEKKKLEKKIKETLSFTINELPITVTTPWKQVMENIQGDSTHIENMLIWLSLNENENTRNSFLSNFDAKYPYITKNGFICAVRAVWKDEIKDELYSFVQSKWKIIKGWKKSPKNYMVINDSGLKLIKKVDYILGTTSEGCLDDLYHNYKPKGVTTYISNYTKNYLRRKDDWTIGSVAEIHDKATHQQICGMNQLHCLSNPKDAIGNKNGNFGDTYLLILVNPKDIINAELGYKFTTSRFYICAEITPEEIDTYFDSHWQSFDYDYLECDVKKLQEVALKQDKKDKLKDLKKGLASYKTNKSVSEEILKNDSSHLSSDLYNKIIESRISLISK